MTEAQRKNAARLRKIRLRASAIHKAHPSGSYQAALKKAGAEFRGKVSGVAKKRKPAKKKAATRKRKHEVDIKVIGAVPHTAAQHKSALVRSLEEQLAWALLAVRQEHRITHRRKLQKKAAELSRKLKAARSL